MSKSEKKKCYTCGCIASFDEPLYEYEDEIYCFDCLLGQLEGDRMLKTYNVKHYATDGGFYLGSEDDIYSLTDEVCSYYEIEKVKE